MNSKTSWDTEPLTAHYNSTETEDGLQALKALGTQTDTHSYTKTFYTKM